MGFIARGLAHTVNAASVVKDATAKVGRATVNIGSEVKERVHNERLVIEAKKVAEAEAKAIQEAEEAKVRAALERKEAQKARAAAKKAAKGEVVTEDFDTKPMNRSERRALARAEAAKAAAEAAEEVLTPEVVNA